jgi:hypothetical protein
LECAAIKSPPFPSFLALNLAWAFFAVPVFAVLDKHYRWGPLESERDANTLDWTSRALRHRAKAHGDSKSGAENYSHRSISSLPAPKRNVFQRKHMLSPRRMNKGGWTPNKRTTAAMGSPTRADIQRAMCSASSARAAASSDGAMHQRASG